MQYAGIWKRFCAFFVDRFVIVPLIVLPLLFILIPRLVPGHRDEELARNFVIYSIALGTLVNYAYFVLCHARSGQTLGKRAMKIRVVQLDGSPIGFQQSLLRSFVDILFAAITNAGFCIAFAALTDEQIKLPSPQIFEAIQKNFPYWLQSFVNLNEFWFIATVFTMQLNPHRRGLHDLLAATAVEIVPPPKTDSVVMLTLR